MRFVALGLHQAVLAARTIWRCCDQFKLAGAIEGLFRRFDEVRAARGFLAMGGRHSNGSVRAQTGTEGPEGPLDAQARLDQAQTRGVPGQATQIAVPVFGCNSHSGIDRRQGLIRR
jgi:hypothetical protein